MQEQDIRKEHFTYHHLGLILSVAVLLLGVSWMKNPDLFDVFNSRKQSNVNVYIPKYYAYETPPEYNQPLVAGASTENQGPMVLNEDGSLSPAVEKGDVLGFSTEDVNIDLSSVRINLIEDSNEEIRRYWNELTELESAHIENSFFENVLLSGDQLRIDSEAEKTKVLEESLLKLIVPKPFEKIHKLKVLQYRSAYGILKNFSKSDDNPELINNHLEIFMKAESQIQEELGTLSHIFESIIFGNNPNE